MKCIGTEIFRHQIIQQSLAREWAKAKNYGSLYGVVSKTCLTARNCGHIRKMCYIWNKGDKTALPFGNRKWLK